MGLTHAELYGSSIARRRGRRGGAFSGETKGGAVQKTVSVCISCQFPDFQPITICSGGMPRTTHGDRFTVTVIKEDEDHVTYELTSRVISFKVIASDFERIA